MRFPRCLLPLLALGASVGAAGCFDDHGVVLEIDVSAAPGTTQVELFLSTKPCGDDYCHAIQPENGNRMPGSVWLRDLATPRLVADLKGHTATFRIETDADTNVRKVIAIGSNKTSGVTGALLLNDLVVSANDAKLVDASLVPAGSSLTTRALVWSATDTTSCAMIAQDDSTGATIRTFIVPDGDKDCDGIPDGEDCAPTGYMEVGALPETLSSCLFQEPVADGPCVLGAAGCVRKTDAPTCAPPPNPICVPTNVCDECVHSLPYQSCHPDFSNLSRIDCRIPLVVTGSCKTEDTVILSPLIGDCGSAAIAPYDGDTDPSAADFNDKVRFGGAEIDVELDKGPCTLKLTRKGGMLQVNGDLTQSALIQIETDHGRTIIPLRLIANTTCTDGGFTCGPEPTVQAFTEDRMWDCTKQ